MLFPSCPAALLSSLCPCTPVFNGSLAPPMLSPCWDTEHGVLPSGDSLGKYHSWEMAN